MAQILARHASPLTTTVTRIRVTRRCLNASDTCPVRFGAKALSSPLRNEISLLSSNRIFLKTSTAQGFACDACSTPDHLIRSRSGISVTLEEGVCLDLERLLDRSLSVDPHPEPEGIRDRAVLVTGAAGSIGSALSLRLLNCRPARLLLLDRSEFNLHRLRLDLEDHPGTSTAEFLLGDLLDTGLLEEVLLRTSPDVVFHVAAFKQVPMLEQHPLAALRNNTLGTAALVRVLGDDGDRRLVTISTDKAVSPRSILGASKRIAELVLLSSAVARPRGTAIRLGNVLGSSGSVLPRFREQMASRRPLTVTHPNVARYFVTAAEAVGLILRAFDLGGGGDILVANLGEPTSILDLARRLLRNAGRDPEEDDGIIFTGLRPGEKLREQMVDSAEGTAPTADPVLRRIVGESPSREQAEAWIEELESLVRGRNARGVVEAVCRILPGYRPSETLLQAIAVPSTLGTGNDREETGR